MSTTAPLSGKTALVTGGSSGIGRAIGERLGAAGAHVILAGRSQAPMDASCKKIREQGGEARAAVLDVRDVAALQGLVESAVADTGRLDVMVNNAGLSHPGSIADGDPEQWREMLEVNVLALLVGSQAALRAMRRVGDGGHIVNVSSVAALRRDSGVYGATKHAVNCITNTMRQELEDDAVRMVTIMPGVVATNFARNYEPEFLQNMAKMVGLEVEVVKGEKLPDEVFEKVQGAMERMIAAPEDIADAVLYAVSAPERLNVAELVVRPAKSLPLP